MKKKIKTEKKEDSTTEMNANEVHPPKKKKKKREKKYRTDHRSRERKCGESVGNMRGGGAKS